MAIPELGLRCKHSFVRLNICFCVASEEIEKQQAKERYMKLHLEGKTEQARADLARLAIIKKQREEAAKKREELRKGELGSISAAAACSSMDCFVLLEMCYMVL